MTRFLYALPLVALGMGWTEIGPEPSPLSTGGLIEVPWDATNRPHKLELSPIDGEVLEEVTFAVRPAPTPRA